MRRWSRKYRRRTDVSFYAVSLDRNQDIGILESRIQEQDLKTVQHVFSGNDIEDEAFLSLHGTTIPYAVVIDRNGVVQFLDIGVSGLESYLDDTTRRLKGAILTWSGLPTPYKRSASTV